MFDLLMNRSTPSWKPNLMKLLTRQNDHYKWFPRGKGSRGASCEGCIAALLVINRRLLQLRVGHDVMLDPQGRTLHLEEGLDLGLGLGLHFVVADVRTGGPPTEFRIIKA